MEDARKIIFDHISSEFKQDVYLSKKYPGLFDKGFLEFLHWFDIAQTRTHSMKNE
jgi:hypothetical protein